MGFQLGTYIGSLISMGGVFFSWMSSFRCSVSYKNNNKNSNFNQFFNFNHNVLFPSVSSMNHQSTTLICSMENSTEPNNALNLDFEPFPEPPLSSNMINVSQFIQHTHTYSHRDRAIGIERVKDPALGRTMENYRPTHRTQANTNTTAPCLLLEIFLRLEWRNRRKNGSKGFGRDSSRPVRGSGSADEDENDSDVTRELRICLYFWGGEAGPY